MVIEMYKCLVCGAIFDKKVKRCSKCGSRKLVKFTPNTKEKTEEKKEEKKISLEDIKIVLKDIVNTLNELLSFL